MRVFIHGWGFDNSVFNGILREEDVKLELPGHGNAIDSLEKATIFYSKLLKDFKSIEIIGWSMGASLGIMLTQCLKNVTSLKLIGFSPYFKEAHDKITISAFMRTMKKDFYKGIKEFRKNAYHSEFNSEYPIKDIALSILEEYINLDLREAVKNLDVSLRLIQGENDIVVPMQEAYKTKELNRRIDIFLYKGGHFPTIQVLKEL
ncbi:MAG: alpha/beta hydrolase [Hydrogenobaculum sp.]|nr:MAG: alpha/beta hydrolase [Hydrogenobaculum sp.]